MGKSIGFKELCSIIDLYKSGTIIGNNTELSISPKDDNSRMIKIGKHGDFFGNNYSFLYRDGEKFDNEILPKLLSYYSYCDNFLKWDAITPQDKIATYKGTTETESGNILYLETYDSSLFDKVIKSKDHFSTRKNDEIIWDELLAYVNSKYHINNYFKEMGFSQEEISNMNKLSINLANNYRDISSRKSNNNDEVLSYAFKILLELNPNDQLLNKIVSDSVNVRQFETLINSEKRLRSRVDINNENIKRKLSLLQDKLTIRGFFDQNNIKNNSNIAKETIMKNQSIITDLILSKDIDYNDRKICYSLLNYISINIFDEKKENVEEEQEFEEYNDVIVDFYEELDEALELIRIAMVDQERYRIDFDSSGPRAKLYITVISGASSNDIFSFEFTNKEKIKAKIRELKNELINNTKDSRLSSIIISEDSSLDKTDESAILGDRNDVLFELIEQTQEKEDPPYVIEIKEAYESVLNIATDENPACIKILFDKNDNDIDVIISNRKGADDVQEYHRSFSFGEQFDTVLNTLRVLYARNNIIDYDFVYQGTDGYTLLMVGENRRTFSIINAQEEFATDNQKRIEQLIGEQTTVKSMI